MRIFAVLLGLLVVGLGVLAGSLPLSGVEPPDLSFVPCGPAVFGRLDPLPHPMCADGFSWLPYATWAFIVAGTTLVVVALRSGRRTNASL